VSLGPAEILVILVVALLIFGPTRLPDIGRQIGAAVREFRRFQQTARRDLDNVLAEDVSDHAEPAPRLPPKDDIASSDNAGSDPPASPEPADQPDTGTKE
jgi:sec-independent protein translocase protein TatA